MLYDVIRALVIGFDFCPKLEKDAFSSQGGARVIQAGYHPRKRSFRTHPKHIFSRYEK